MKLFLLFTLFVIIDINAQSNDMLMVWPHHLHYNSDFERSQIVHIENNTMNTIIIDSITYNPNIYLLRLSSKDGFPIVLESNAKLTLEVIQYNYFNLQPSDTTSNIYIHNLQGLV